jgi:CBS domain-containing protein
MGQSENYCTQNADSCLRQTLYKSPEKCSGDPKFIECCPIRPRSQTLMAEVLHDEAVQEAAVERTAAQSGRIQLKERRMASVSDVVKTRLTHSANPEMTVLEAARIMTERNIGALPVLRDGRLLGIFSERDVMTRVVAAGRSPGSTKLSEVMTPYPRTVTPEESVENCLFMMKEFGFRHLPICAGDEFVGLVSVRDLMLFDHRRRPA